MLVYTDVINGVQVQDINVETSQKMQFNRQNDISD